MTITSEQACFTLIGKVDDSESVNEQILKQDLESGNDNAKIATMKRLIHLMLNGEKLSSLLMTVIRFVLPTQNHILKKLLFIYFEIIPKTTAEGKLRHEMILVIKTNSILHISIIIYPRIVTRRLFELIVYHEDTGK